MTKPIHHIAIFGASPDAPLAALFLKRKLNNFCPRVTLIKPNSEAGSMVFSTTPTLRSLHAELKIPEPSFVKQTKAEINLGTEFSGFTQQQRPSIYTPQAYGFMMENRRFQYLFKQLLCNNSNESIEDYNLTAVMARLGRFSPPSNKADSLFSNIDYGYSVHQTMYTSFLESLCLKDSIEIHNSDIRNVDLDSHGAINELYLQEGTTVSADFYFDCSFGQLLHKAVSSESTIEDSYPFELIEQRVFTQFVQTKPYSRVEATQNQLILCSDHDKSCFTQSFKLAEDEPQQPSEGFWFEPKPWKRNCITLGPASVRRIESVIGDIELSYHSLNTFMALWPRTKFFEIESRTYNKIISTKYRKTLDLDQFLIAIAFNKQDFLPESVRQRLNAFCYNASSMKEDDSVLTEQQWSALFYSLGYVPKYVDVSVKDINTDTLSQQFRQFKETLKQAAESLPSYESFTQKVHY